MSTPYGRFRLSDNERNDAMGALSTALGEGRLTVTEFDERARRVAAAEFQADLEPIFSDIPQAPTAYSPAGGEVTLYGAGEISAARRDGQKMRAGVFWLGTLGALAGAPALAVATGSGLGYLLFLLIPTLFVLLYMMKVGPDSWYTPSVRQLERRRRELVRIRQLEIESARAHEEALRKAARKQQLSALTDDALSAAHHTVKRLRGK
ncbi:DUF1707 domain-containing protein [Corynebacterium liangguodongii]|uniref:Uncharacterized protein n=1 Tax=Corynebacterium liangguodongii TaxID=2079535 RepID=A0A2S0WG45_9CORY|nr:DUF1707 domain-containing protein [Corynebacterium liangguodongii]AWB84747.1 hypothetical protein C3E79_09905 [Corynebacterium liangguodongii]PWB99755.1 DUF1707 domain-containing protein [Corynebacterium liangguodongii]